ncbi:MAG: DUF4433 domain-containing protein [Acidobacteriota bacterium]|nr:DUF4433 domain-containing protein [Acidobacteriota bacterium]
MDRAELVELQYITRSENIASIIQHGILSNKLARYHNPVSIALTDVQDIRERRSVPGGRPLHEYVNLYVCARNPMMYLRRDQHLELAVIQVSPAIVDIRGVVVTDANAASGYSRFAPAPGGIDIVDGTLTFAHSWKHPDDEIQEWRHKSMKCAEVLVPDRVSPEYLIGAYVSCEQAKASILQIVGGVAITVDPYMFFQATVPGEP